MSETTALGAAIAAGCANGIRKWDVKLDASVPSDTFLPSITEDGEESFILYKNSQDEKTLSNSIPPPILSERDVLYSQWKMAIDRSLGWEPVVEDDGEF